MEQVTVEDAGGNLDHTALHARNFLDCIRFARNPTAMWKKATDRPR